MQRNRTEKESTVAIFVNCACGHCWYFYLPSSTIHSVSLLSVNTSVGLRLLPSGANANRPTSVWNHEQLMQLSIDFAAATGVLRGPSDSPVPDVGLPTSTGYRVGSFTSAS